MEENLEFHTRDFLFENGTLFLFRKGHLHKKILYEKIELVTLKKGSDLKRPGIAIGFGIALLLFNFWVFMSAGFNFYEFFDSGLFFIAGIGLYAIYSGAPIHPIIEIKFDNHVVRHSTSMFIRKKMMEAFIAYLQMELGPLRVRTGNV